MRERIYTYAQLASSSVSDFVASHYDFQGPYHCKFYVSGLHDNYLLETKRGKFILRIYRNTWRSREETNFELELLAFLGERTVQVASPLLTTSGALSFDVESPEGERVAALFRYANGRAPGIAITPEESAMLGRVVANVHSMSATFSTPHARPVLDIPYLLDESIMAIKPFIDYDGLSYLGDLQRKLHDVMPRLQKVAGVYGICAGDISPTNFHVDQNKQITLFDFDQCGFGYRAFEIGKFFSSIHSHSAKHIIEDAFLDGYRHVRKLSSTECEAIPYFEIVSVIWVMAIHAYNANRIGHKMLEKPFWDRRLGILKELASVPHLSIS